MSDGFLARSGLDERPLLDRLDARVRIGAALAIVVAVLALRSLPLLVALVPVAAGLALLGGVRPGELAHRLKHVEGFLLVLVLLLPLTVPGEAVASLGPLAISGAGLRRALEVLARVNLAAITVTTLIGGLEPVRLGHGLAALGMPEKLVHLLLFAARWVALVREEAGRLADALRARAFRAAPTRHGLATLAAFVGQLLVRAYERAERVDEAMRCRAFSGRFALVVETRIARADRLFAALTGLALVLLLAADRLT